MGTSSPARRRSGGRAATRWRSLARDLRAAESKASHPLGFPEGSEVLFCGLRDGVVPCACIDGVVGRARGDTSAIAGEEGLRTFGGTLFLPGASSSKIGSASVTSISSLTGRMLVRARGAPLFRERGGQSVARFAAECEGLDREDFMGGFAGGGGAAAPSRRINANRARSPPPCITAVTPTVPTPATRADHCAGFCSRSSTYRLPPAAKRSTKMSSAVRTLRWYGSRLSPRLTKGGRPLSTRSSVTSACVSDWSRLSEAGTIAHEYHRDENGRSALCLPTPDVITKRPAQIPADVELVRLSANDLEQSDFARRADTHRGTPIPRPAAHVDLRVFVLREACKIGLIETHEEMPKGRSDPRGCGHSIEDRRRDARRL